MAALLAVVLLAGSPAPAGQSTSRITVPRLPDPALPPPTDFSDRYRPAGRLGRDAL